jgi:hypothetical protein
MSVRSHDQSAGAACTNIDSENVDLHNFQVRFAQKSFAHSSPIRGGGNLTPDGPARRRSDAGGQRMRVRAVDDLSGTEIEARSLENGAQFFLGGSNQASSLKRSGEPGRTRTSKLLIKSSLVRTTRIERCTR